MADGSAGAVLQIPGLSGILRRQFEAAAVHLSDIGEGVLLAVVAHQRGIQRQDIRTPVDEGICGQLQALEQDCIQANVEFQALLGADVLVGSEHRHQGVLPFGRRTHVEGPDVTVGVVVFIEVTAVGVEVVQHISHLRL